MKAAASINKEKEYLQVFQKVTKLITMVLDPQQVMDMVVRSLPELLDVDAVTIRLLDSSTNTFVLGAAHGLSDEYLSRGRTVQPDHMLQKCTLATARSAQDDEYLAREDVESQVVQHHRVAVGEA